MTLPLWHIDAVYRWRRQPRLRGIFWLSSVCVGWVV